MARISDNEDPEVEAAEEPMRPIRFVQRELTRPDGTTVKVDVPVYPPFELKPKPKTSTRTPRKPPAPRARRKPKSQKTG